MRSIIILLLIIGIVMLTTGYQNKLLDNAEIKERIEYRYIPASIYEEQFGKPNLTRSFKDMFEYDDVYLNKEY